MLMLRSFHVNDPMITPTGRSATVIGRTERYPDKLDVRYTDTDSYESVSLGEHLLRPALRPDFLVRGR